MQRLMPAIADAQGDMLKVAGDSVFPVLNMLNTKYFILPLQNNNTMPMPNPYAYGNAWFVNKVTFVDTPNEEIMSLEKMNLRQEAVANNSFKEKLANVPALSDSTDKITMTSYDCNELHYDVETKNGGLAVFSEIYYPEWTATLDGKPLELACVDYVLRGAVIPAGKHQIVMEFRPVSVKTTEAIAYVAIVILILSFLASAYITFRKKIKAEPAAAPAKKK